MTIETLVHSRGGQPRSTADAPRPRHELTAPLDDYHVIARRNLFRPGDPPAASIKLSAITSDVDQQHAGLAEFPAQRRDADSVGGRSLHAGRLLAARRSVSTPRRWNLKSTDNGEASASATRSSPRTPDLALTPLLTVALTDRQAAISLGSRNFFLDTLPQTFRQRHTHGRDHGRHSRTCNATDRGRWLMA